jgi:hypothetical protein
MLPVYRNGTGGLGWHKKIFFDWYTNYFCPSVLRFCQENELAAKALILLDKPLAILETFLKSEYFWTSVMFT